jgi:phosphoribosylformylglycinamidine synthase
LASAHDVADGGLAATLAECCAGGEAPTYGPGIGASIELARADSELESVAALFGEAPSRVVVSVPPDAVPRVLGMAQNAGVPAIRVGQTGGDALAIEAAPLGRFSVRVADIRTSRESCLTAIVGG